MSDPKFRWLTQVHFRLLPVCLAASWGITCLAQGKPDVRWVDARPPTTASSMASSPDGRLLAIGSYGELWIFDAATFAFRGMAPTNVGSPHVAFSPDGKLLACGGNSGLELRNVSDLTLARSLPTQSVVSAVCFSPDGRTLVDTGIGMFETWRVADGTLLKSKIIPTAGYLVSVAVSPDGSTVATSGTAQPVGANQIGFVATWRLSDLTLLENYKTNTTYEDAVAFSPDGTKLASVGAINDFGGGSNGSVLELWNVLNGTLLKTFQTGMVFNDAVAYSPDGQLLAIGGNGKRGDGTTTSVVELWSVARGTRFKVLSTQSTLVTSLAFSPDGKTLTGDGDTSLTSWWLPTGGGVRKEVQNGITDCRSVVFLPGSQNLVSCGSYNTGLLPDVTGTLSVTRTSDGSLSKTLSGEGGLQGVSVPYAKNLIAEVENSVRDGALLKIRRIPDLAVLKALPSQVGYMLTVALSPDGTLVADGGNYSTTDSHGNNVGLVEIWNAFAGSHVSMLPTQALIVDSVVFSPDGRYIAVGGTDSFYSGAANGKGVLEIWDASAGTLTRTLPTSAQEIQSVAFSSHGEILAAGGDMRNPNGSRLDGLKPKPIGVLELWHVADGTLRKTLPTRIPTVFTVAFPPDTNTVFAGGSDRNQIGFLEIWSVAGGNLLKSYDEETGLGVYSIAFTTEGSLFAYGRADGVLVEANNPYFVSPHLTSVSLAAASISGGSAETGTLRISSVAPFAGVSVSLTSSDEGVLTVPSEVLVPEKRRTVDFILTTKKVTSLTKVTVTAKRGDEIQTVTVTLTP